MKVHISGILCLTACICSFLSFFVLPSRAQQNTWQQQSIDIRCKDSSLEQAIEQLAAQINISVVVDGLPLSKSFTLETRMPAGQALTQIATAFDCSWSMSKSGILLLRRRFTDEHERPQILPAEMRPFLHNLLSLISTVYTPKPGKSLSSSFRELEADLSPDALKMFDSVEGIPVYTLSSALQQQATQIIFQNQLNSATYRLSEFDKQLSALPEASLKTESVLFAGGVSFTYVVLDFAPMSGLQRVLLYSTDQRKAITQLTPASTTPRSTQMQAFSIKQTLTMLNDRFHLNVTCLPKNDDRRILLRLQDKDAPRLPAALAELYGWTLQQPNANTFYLLRRQISLPPAISDWGPSLLQALPPDVAKWLTTLPATLDGKPYSNPEQEFPMLPKTGNFTMSVIGSKMIRQKNESEDALQLAAQGETFTQPRSYNTLSPELQREIVYHLFYSTITQAKDGILPFLVHLPSWVADPLHARLSRTGTGYRIVGSGGGSVTVSEAR